MLIGFGVGILDLIDLIPVAGDFTDLLTMPVNYYLYLKGINGIPFLGAEILDLIPIAQEFPTRSIVWWGTVLFEAFAPEELVEAAEKIGEKAQGKEELGGTESLTAKAESATQDVNAKSEITKSRNGVSTDGQSEEPALPEADMPETAGPQNDYGFGPPPSPMEDLEQSYFEEDPYTMMHEAEVAKEKEESEISAETPRNVVDIREPKEDFPQQKAA